MHNDTRLCQSANKHRVIGLIETGECARAVAAGITQVSETPETHVTLPRVEIIEKTQSVKAEKPFVQFNEKPKFSVNQMFANIENLTDMVITGASPALLVTGVGGLGKSYTVMERFKRRGLIKSTDHTLGDFTLVKGKTTAKDLFNTLYTNREGIVIYDDCDTALEDKNAIMILKGALDSDDRTITWGAEMKKASDLPRSFEFKGGFISISNKFQEDIDQAIRTRVDMVNLVMTTEEKLERIETVLEHIEGYTMEVKMQALSFLKEYAHITTDLNFRTLTKVSKYCKYAMDTPEANCDWKALALSTISA